MYERAPGRDSEYPGIDWGKLKDTVFTAVLFMNRVLDKTKFPIPECQEAMDRTRKIGVGIMGLHDLLIQLGLAYDSKRGREIAEAVMAFISKQAERESIRLCDSQGMYTAATFGHNDGRENSSPKRRNANLTTIAPTGTLSMIADCSSGCEPYFAPVTNKEVPGGTIFNVANKWLPDDIVQDIRMGKTDPVEIIRCHKVGHLFKGARDIRWQDHVKMQAVLQRHVDSNISKTINIPEYATVDDVKDAYEFAWKLGCKGLTIYRDKSRQNQVLSSSKRDIVKDEYLKQVEFINLLKEAGVIDDKRGSGGDEEDIRQIGESQVECPKEPRTIGVCRDAPKGAGPGVDSAQEVDYLPTPYKLNLPDELNAKRYRIRDNNGDKKYVIVCNYEEDFVGMFIKYFFELPNGYFSIIFCLIILVLRYNIFLDDVIKELWEGSTSVVDIFAKLARTFDKYKSKGTQVGVCTKGVNEIKLSLRDKVGPVKIPGINTCPECTETLVPGGGCVSCPNCGWGEC